MRPMGQASGNDPILAIGDQFAKGDKAKPLLHQTSVMTADALDDYWINPLGCLNSFHNNQGWSFESKLFDPLTEQLEMEKTRITLSHQQPNAVIERLKTRLQNVLAKCVVDGQSKSSKQFPEVKRAYQSSIHESIAYTPQFLFFGEDWVCFWFCLPNHQEKRTAYNQELVYSTQQDF